MSKSPRRRPGAFFVRHLPVRRAVSWAYSTRRSGRAAIAMASFCYALFNRIRYNRCPTIPRLVKRPALVLVGANDDRQGLASRVLEYLKTRVPWRASLLQRLAHRSPFVTSSRRTSTCRLPMSMPCCASLSGKMGRRQTATSRASRHCATSLQEPSPFSTARAAPMPNGQRCAGRLLPVEAAAPRAALTGRERSGHLRRLAQSACPRLGRFHEGGRETSEQADHHGRQREGRRRRQTGTDRGGCRSA